MGNLHARGALLHRHDLPIEAGIDALETVIEQAGLQHDAAVGIVLGGGDHAVEIVQDGGVEIVLHRRAEGVGQHQPADHQAEHGPHRGGGDQPRGEGIKLRRDLCRQRSDLRGYSQGHAPFE